MSPLDNFDRDFERQSRAFRRFSILVGVLIGAVWVAVLASLIAMAIILVRVGPDGLAHQAGHLFGTFMAAALEKQP